METMKRIDELKESLQLLSKKVDGIFMILKVWLGIGIPNQEQRQILIERLSQFDEFGELKI